MRLPHIRPFAKSPLYFFTACAAGRRHILATQSAFDVLTDVWRRSGDLDGWFVGRFVLMPDHVHFFAMAAPTAKPREVWLKMWKSVSSRRLAKALNSEASIWQS